MRHPWRSLTPLFLLALLSAFFLSAPADSTAGQARVAEGQLTPDPEANVANITVSLGAVADAMLASDAPGVNYGDSNYTIIAYAAAYKYSYVIRFDLSSLPPAAIIDSASMSLLCHELTSDNQLPTVSIGAYYVTSNWSESTVTWNTTLTTLGAGIGAWVDTNWGWKSWSVTSFAQAWHSNPAQNRGMILRGLFSGSAYGRFFLTREAASSDRPRLVVTYHLPEQSPTPTRTATRTPTRTVTTGPSPTPTRTPTHVPGSPLRRYLPVLLKADPLPPTCPELVYNGGFETGSFDGWDPFGPTGIGPGRLSEHAAWLGGQNNGHSELSQAITISAGATSAVWGLWWKAEAASPQPGDRFVMLVVDGEGGATLKEVHADAPLNVWHRELLDLTPYAGRRVLLSLVAATDGSVPTTFRIDDVTVRACR